MDVKIINPFINATFDDYPRTIAEIAKNVIHND